MSKVRGSYPSAECQTIDSAQRSAGNVEELTRPHTRLPTGRDAESELCDHRFWE